MTSYILIIAMTFYKPSGESFQISEFQSKEACEIALNEARKFWRTVDNDSKCLSVKTEIEKQQAKDKLKELGGD